MATLPLFDPIPLLSGTTHTYDAYIRYCYVDRAQAAEGPAQEGQGEGEVCHGPVAADDGPWRGRRPNAADAALPPAPPARTQLGSQAPPGQ